MRSMLRRLWDKVFTSLAGLSVLLMGAALVVILGPMLWKGAGAVVFRGTVEFRRMQLTEPLFNRGDARVLEAEFQQVAAARQRVYDILEGPFAQAMNPQALVDRVRRADRELGRQLQNREHAGQMSRQQVAELRSASRTIRDELTLAFQAETNQQARAHLEVVLASPSREALAGTVGELLFTTAEDFAKVIESADISRREEYTRSLQEIVALVEKLFGPAPGQRPRADLAQFRYGATRWDQALAIREEIVYRPVWVDVGDGQPRELRRISRADTFAGTEVESLFSILENDLAEMMNPRLTFYWQYFIDDCTPGHYFGGVGIEILGTLLVALLTIAMALPVGVVAAGYLVECTRVGFFVGLIRMCINTLAGVPSIVFGLFGLAFFVLKVQPALGLRADLSIFAGAMTLAVLVLPVIIRAAEEAIKAVPASYKEASLALGAGGMRTFLTVTLPAAAPGILTGVILAVSRAAGETAPLLFTAAVASRQGMPDSIFQGGARILSYSSYDVAMNDKVAMQVPHQQFGITMTLILLVLALNITAIVIRSRMARKLRGQ